ncbi:hypothetical protein ACFO1B_46490 [Dactylosporangium siamense]|uniref:Uncharacterized protein n=1 Tax=Dactylosporangium siamense TaxID=685454 RepID=A0A919PVU3_9ACTN|nr:hypothetical protein [Dactylosporangium siamense]GIG51421.1 hypothetical protein Dsi01nite_094620 [Dactylosporangium siamense]
MSAGWRARVGWTGWRRELGWSLIPLGMAVPCGLTALGPAQFIPSQDATSEMMAQEARDGDVTLLLAAVGCAAGTLVVATGIWLIWRARRLDRRHPDDGPAVGLTDAGQYEP